MGQPAHLYQNKVCTVHKDKKITALEILRFFQYDFYPWLSTSTYLNKLFCWLCLLLSKSHNAWISEGFYNLSNLDISQENTFYSPHLQWRQGHLLFGQQRIDETLDSRMKFNKSEHNKSL
jgi:hypothetical protein